MFGNLLDNAIEACGKFENPDDKVIHLKTAKERGTVPAETINKTSGPAQFLDGLPKSTKEHGQNHGFGMKSIHSITQRYNGMMMIKVENGQFQVKIVFPRVEHSTQAE